MIKKRFYLTIFVLGVAVLLGSLGYFGYTAWQVYQGAHGKASTELTPAEIEKNKNKLTDAFANAGISYLNVTRGFWTRTLNADGVEELVFLSVDDLARRGLTEWQINEILTRLASSSVESRDSMRMVPQSELPKEYQFHNEIYTVARGTDEFVLKRQALEDAVASGAYTAASLFELGYLYELEAKYKERDRLYAQACTEFGERCERDMTVTVHGRVVDAYDVPIVGARVSVVSVSQAPEVLTDTKGEYSLTLPVRTMEKVRVKASKKNYSDGVVQALVVTKERRDYTMDTITLSTPLVVVHVNNDVHTITGGEAQISADGAEFVTSSGFVTYYIPWDAIVRKDGLPYRGDIDILMYEFSKATAPDSLLVADVLTPELGFSGDVMVTFGMPYIQFFTPSGEELHVLKSHPMRLVQKMAPIDMERLKSNSDAQAERGLTEQDLRALVDASTFGDYALTFEYLAKHHLDHFPAYWVFDRTAGVWDNIGMNVLDMDGTVETYFYTINDER